MLFMINTQIREKQVIDLLIYLLYNYIYNGLNKFVWDFNYNADDDDKRIFNELNIDNKRNFK